MQRNFGHLSLKDSELDGSEFTRMVIPTPILLRHSQKHYEDDGASDSPRIFGWGIQQKYLIDLNGGRNFKDFSMKRDFLSPVDSLYVKLYRRCSGILLAQNR